MTLKTIYITRHGYRANWLPKDQQPPNPTGIDSDPPLAPHGVDQADELSQFITKSLNPKPQVIFSSPFYRCVETALPTAKALNIDIFLERGVGEWYRPDRDIIPQPADHERLNKFFGCLTEEWPWDTVIPSPKGEHESDIFARCKKFWELFIPKFESKFPDYDTVLIVTHAATKIALDMSLLGYADTREFLKPEHGGDGKTTRIEASTCSLDHLILQDDGSWSIVMNGRTDFLSGGAEMNWHFASSVFEAGSKEDIEFRR
ncbi:hypothetical protein CANARDRAFT_187450, partial [[Candida] arabinofermentans NRRL YB-2248]